MRVKVEYVGKRYFGEFIGLHQNDCDHCGPGASTPTAIVRADGFGLMLLSIHPSAVTVITPEEEETYKP